MGQEGLGDVRDVGSTGSITDRCVQVGLIQISDGVWEGGFCRGLGPVGGREEEGGGVALGGGGAEALVDGRVGRGWGCIGIGKRQDMGVGASLPQNPCAPHPRLMRLTSLTRA